MALIKIFVYPTHCSPTVTPGVDYARLIRPMEELGKQPGFKVTVFDYNKMPSLDWREIAKEYDILYLNYMTLPWDFAMIGLCMRKEGKKIVFDIDDLIWEIKSDNSSYDTYKKGSEGRHVVTSICNEADYLTTTSEYLKHGIMSYTTKDSSHIGVLPNFIDLKLYKNKLEANDDYPIRIGYFGSSSHFVDLGSEQFLGGLERLMAENPRVEFYTVGAMLQQIKKRWGPRYITGFGHQDIYQWVQMMPRVLSKVDIFAVPLEDTTYDRSKSSIKYLEMSSMGVPGVYQDIRQYKEIITDGENGFLAKTADDWYKKLKKLADDVNLRQTMGQKAYKTIEKDWTIQKQVKLHKAFFKQVMKSPIDKAITSSFNQLIG